jgi:hypothetical protein
LIESHQELIFANDLFLFSLCDSLDTREIARLFYEQYLLPTRKRLDAIQPGKWLSPITELDPKQYRNILQIGGRVFERWAHVYYPKPFYTLCRDLKADPFVHARDYYFRTHEFFKFKRMFNSKSMAYYHDMRMMFTLNFDFYALAPKSHFKDVFRGIRTFYAHGRLEQGEQEPQIQITTPSRFLEINEYAEFQGKLYDPTLYMKYDLPPVTESSPPYAFAFKNLPDGILVDYALPSKNKPFPVQKAKMKEDLAYFYPVHRFFNHMQYERFKTKTQDRYAILQENTGLPILFVITPDIYLNFMEYWALDRNGVPPIVHLLCKNKYLRFAVFSEVLKTKLPQEGHLNFYEFFRPIYLGPAPNSKAPPQEHDYPKKEYGYLSMKWGVNESIRRYEALCIQTSKDKKWHFGGVIVSPEALQVKHMKGGIYMSYDVMTLQQALRYMLDVFSLPYESVTYDVSTWAFTEKPKGLKDATLYTLDRDIRPVYKGIKSVRAFRKKFGIANKYWYGDRAIYENELPKTPSASFAVKNEPVEIAQIKDQYKKARQEYEDYQVQIQAAEQNAERLEEERKRNIKEIYHGDKIAYEYAKFKAYEDSQRLIRLQKLSRPLCVQVMEPIAAFITEEYGELEAKLPLIQECVKELPVPRIQMSSSKYAMAAAIMSVLAEDYGVKKIKQFFKDLCAQEESAYGFGVNYKLYLQECKHLLLAMQEKIQAPPKEESGVTPMESPTNPEYDSFMASITDATIVPILQSMVDDVVLYKIDRGSQVQYDLSPVLRNADSNSDVWIIEQNSDSKEADQNLLYTLQKDKDPIASQYGISQIFIHPKDPERIYAIFQSLENFAWVKFCMYLNTIETKKTKVIPIDTEAELPGESNQYRKVWEA